jgi:hypothetical protein
VSAQDAQLLRMARQIAANCGARGDSELAARKTAAHLRRFWAPAMIEQLDRHLQGSEDGDPVLLASMALLRYGD